MQPYAYTQDKLFIGGEWVAPIEVSVITGVVMPVDGGYLVS
jgi:hypothetical protein